MYIEHVFWFSVRLLFATFLILRRCERDVTTNYMGIYVKYRYSPHILVKPEFSR